MGKHYLKDHYLEKLITTRRCLLAFLIILLLVGGLLARIIYLQVIEHSYYTTLSKNNRIEIIPIAPTRGLIYDRNGILLAENIPAYNLELTPSKIKDLDKTIQQIGEIIPLSQREIDVFHKTLHQKRRFETVPLKLKLSEKQVAVFSVNRYRLPGVEVKAGLMRHYPEGENLAHVVGYVGRINAREAEQIDEANYSATNYIGKTGIEKFYESTLHGKVGYRRIEVDAAGNLVRELDVTPAQPGETLYLSIDSQLQKVATKALGTHVGSIVAIDPDNGEVLTLVSNPNFDPNLFVKGLSHQQYQALQSDTHRPLYNRALRGLYPPGSTVKPFIALEGLDSNTVDSETTIHDPGFFKLPFSDHIFHDWKRSGHGEVNLHKSIVESCDTYYYWLANQLRIEKLDKILSAFGFGQSTGIDMTEELSGLVPSPEWKQAHRQESWYPGDTLNTGIGQGFMLATPLQLANATATLSTRGKQYTPHLVIASKTNDLLMPTIPTLKNDIVLSNPAHWNDVIKAMEGVIKETHGTGFRFGKDASYSAAAKTGTAQVISLKQQKSKKYIAEKFRDNDLFIAFAPTDHARIAIAVVVEHSRTIAPVATRKVLDYYLTHLTAGAQDGTTQLD